MSEQYDEKYNASTRRLKLLGMIRGRRNPLTIAGVAKHFGRSYDTINRDLDVLELAGFPTDRVTDEDGARRIVPRGGERLDAAFTPAEVQALAALGPVVAPFRGTLLHHGFECALGKITDTLGAKDRLHVENSRRRFFYIADGGVLPYDDAAKSAICDTLFVATLRDRRVRFTYQSIGGTRYEGTLEPYVLCVHGCTLYVLGRPVPEPGGEPALPPIVRWPVHRFVAAELTRQEFRIPADFRIEDHFNGWGIVAGQQAERVVIEFSARIAPLIAERSWRPAPRLEGLAHGRLRFTCTVACTPELTAWILGYGADARVIEPKVLREEILDHHRRALAAASEPEPSSEALAHASNDNDAEPSSIPGASASDGQADAAAPNATERVASSSGLVR
jgi:predicted DNA-binding transcriptional regulator YafY